MCLFQETIVNNFFTSEEANTSGNLEPDSEENSGFTFGFELNQELLSMTFNEANAFKEMQEPEM